MVNDTVVTLFGAYGMSFSSHFTAVMTLAPIFLLIYWSKKEMIGKTPNKNPHNILGKQRMLHACVSNNTRIAGFIQRRRSEGSPIILLVRVKRCKQ